jgi:aminoglycoside/choline kinase family phosphotransferase
MMHDEHSLGDVLRRATGHKAREIEAMTAHASARRYYRARLAGDATLVLMVLPQERTKAEEFTDGNLRLQELPFLAVQARLKRAGLPVPEVIGYAEADGVVVLEDLGDVTLEDYLSSFDAEDFEVYYREAVRLVTTLQRNADVIAEGSIIAERRFDERVLALEFDHFREYGLEARLGVRLDRRERARFDDCARDLVNRLVALPQTVVHRDFQSRNLMLRDKRLALIDFQDALIGPYVYDLVALLRDSYIVLERPFIDRMLAFYKQVMPEAPSTLARDFDLQTVQRKLKDAGRFVFIDQVKGNPAFLRFFDPSVAYAQEALRRLNAWPDLVELVARVGKPA